MQLWVECPVCRTVVYVPNNIFRNLPKNIIATNIVGLLKDNDEDYAMDTQNVSNIGPQTHGEMSTNKFNPNSVKPVRIIPFVFDIEAAKSLVITWVESLHMKPTSFSRNEIVFETARCLYVPAIFYELSLNTKSKVSFTVHANDGEREERKNRQHEKQYSGFHPCQRVSTDIDGYLNKTIDTHLLNLSWRYEDSILEDVTRMSNGYPFLPFCEDTDGVYFSSVYKKIVNSVKKGEQNHWANDATQRSGDRKIEIVVKSVDAEMDLLNTSVEKIYLPVCYAMFRYNGKQYGYLVNGYNGAVYGDKLRMWNVCTNS